MLNSNIEPMGSKFAMELVMDELHKLATNELNLRERALTLRSIVGYVTELMPTEDFGRFETILDLLEEEVERVFPR
jgi:hypothetical protein